jgi:thymidylate kinase
VRSRARHPLLSAGRLRRTEIVTLSGLDGAGKSSQAALVSNALEQQGVRVAVVWVPVAINPSVATIRAAARSVLRFISRGAPRSHDGGSAQGSLDPGKRLVRRSALARHAWSSLVTLMNVSSHWRSLLDHRGRADVVIFDRYVLDTAVRLHTWYSGLGRVGLETWLCERLSPRPLCSYFLDVPPDRALARKVDRWDLPTLQRQAESYRRECKRLGVRRLDGERSKEDLAADITSEVLDRLAVELQGPPRKLRRG